MANVTLQESAAREVERTIQPKRLRKLPQMIILNLVLIILVLVTIIPFLYMVFSAFKQNAEIFSVPLTFWPRNPTWDNLQALFAQFPFVRWMLNTTVVAVGGTITAVFLSSLAGFGFAKYNFRFKNTLFIIMLITILVPYQVLLVPQFEVIRFLGWFNTYQGLIIPRAVGAFGIFLMRQYTVAVPSELLDAARIDGASEFNIWWRIVVPLVRPGLAVLGILSFTALWNDFIWPLVVTTDTSMFVANLGLASLIGPYDFQYGIVLCGSFLASLPVIVIFLIFQRQFIEGFTQGAFRG
jgi:ABC-type glycerol-3-phosphate transport system permease component